MAGMIVLVVSWTQHTVGVCLFYSFFASNVGGFEVPCILALDTTEYYWLHHACA